jgi:8-oxo-dGTP pyrophosphatase MutT (NUDIX family)
VVSLDRIAFSHAPLRWNFAETRREDIDAHFAARLAKTPSLWNGRVLLASECTLAEATLRGSFFETDFASFVAWRDWGFPDRAITNCFAMGAIRASDGAYLLGVMGPATANPGLAYFPAGTPDPADIVDDRVDLDGSVMREVTEETGLTRRDVDAQPGWSAVFAGPRIALMKELRARENAQTLRAKILHYLAQQAEPELVDVRIVRDRRDIDESMPEFMMTFLSRVLADPHSGG